MLYNSLGPGRNFFQVEMDPRKPRATGVPTSGFSNLLRFALALQGEATEVFSIDADEGSGSWIDPPELRPVPRLVTIILEGERHEKHGPGCLGYIKRIYTIPIFVGITI